MKLPDLQQLQQWGRLLAQKGTLFLRLSVNYRYLYMVLYRHYLLGLLHRAEKHHLFLMAGGLAFSLFVCIVPFVLIIFWIVGLFLESSAVEIQINTFIDTMIPYETYAAFVKKILYSRIVEVIQYRTIAGVVGIVGVLFAATGFFSSVRTILHAIFKAQKSIGAVAGKLRDIVLVILAIILLLASTLLFPLLEIFRNASEDLAATEILGFGILPALFSTLFSLTLMIVLFYFLYRFVPVVKLSNVSLVTGAICSAVFWEAAKQIFGYYIYHLASFGKIYGAYAIIVVLAFWIYYSVAVFIAGAELAQLHHERNGQTLIPQ